MNDPVYLVDDDDAVREALALLLRTVGLGVRGFAFPAHSWPPSTACLPAA